MCVKRSTHNHQNARRMIFAKFCEETHDKNDLKLIKHILCFFLVGPGASGNTMRTTGEHVSSVVGARGYKPSLKLQLNTFLHSRECLAYAPLDPLFRFAACFSRQPCLPQNLKVLSEGVYFAVYSCFISQVLRAESWEDL